MPKKDNLSGERNFLITMSKQTKGSDGFMPSGHRHFHHKFWYIVIGIIVVIVLFIFGENMLASHQSKNTPTHHTKVTRVAKSHKHKAKKHSDKAKRAKQAKEKRAAAAKRRRAHDERIARKRREAVRREDRTRTTSYRGRYNEGRVRTTPTRTVNRSTATQTVRSTPRVNTAVKSGNVNTAGNAQTK